MYQQRPKMHARDSSGRQVSLLNDEPSRASKPQFPTEYSYPSPDMARSTSNHSGRSGGSSPLTPGLMRADSYDSQHTNDAHSPLTPTYMGEFARHNSYSSTTYKETQYENPESMGFTYPQYPTSMPVQPYHESRSNSYPEPHVVYEDDPYQPTKGGKRYPCRFKDSHGCDRTFTTSGHASRHSKIHTAEKAVNCTHPGCQKKFTRADNMKQHLETHYKERSRSTTSQKVSASKSSLTIPAGVKKQVAPSNGRSSRASNRGETRAEILPMDPALFEPQYASSKYGSLNMSGFQEALVSPSTAHANGLDALAAAAADYQQSRA